MALVVFVGAGAFSQEQAEEKPAEEMPAKEEQAPEAEKSPEEIMMESYLKYAGPADQHEYLKFFVGAWDVLVKSWVDPEAEPHVSQGVAEAKLIFDGRFLSVKFRTKFMKPVMEGIQMNGFDLFKEKYFTLWIDNMSTNLSITYGTLDEENKVLTEEGMWPDYMTGGERKVKAVTTILKENEYMWQMFYFNEEGQEYKVMENIFKRIK